MFCHLWNFLCENSLQVWKNFCSGEHITYTERICFSPKDSCYSYEYWKANKLKDVLTIDYIIGMEMPIPFSFGDSSAFLELRSYRNRNTSQ